MSFKEKFRQIKKFPDWVYKPLAWMLYGYKACMRTAVYDPYNLLETCPPPAITVTWHNRLLFFPLMFPKKFRFLTTAVISASRDGQYIADLCKQLGIDSARGSSRKKGANALHSALNAVKNKKYVAFTPDGPRGPRYRMSIGPIYMASREHLPIVPIAINYSSWWALKSWDGFRIPKPFAKVSLVLGKPIDIPGNLTEEELEPWRVKVEEALNNVSEVHAESGK